MKQVFQAVVSSNSFTPKQGDNAIRTQGSQGVKGNKTLARRSVERTINEQGSIREKMEVDVALKFLKSEQHSTVRRKKLL